MVCSIYRLFQNICDGELWTETKVLRRFLWHDRIHAKALYRHGLKMGMSVKTISAVPLISAVFLMYSLPVLYSLKKHITLVSLKVRLDD